MKMMALGVEGKIGGTWVDSPYIRGKQRTRERELGSGRAKERGWSIHDTHVPE